MGKSDDFGRRLSWPLITILLCVLVVLGLWLRRLPSHQPTDAAGQDISSGPAPEPQPSLPHSGGSSGRSGLKAATADQIVSRKLAQFGQSRRQLAYALAQRHHVSVSDDVEKFFAAVESGNWEEIDATFKVIDGGDSSAGYAHQRTEEVSKMWPAIIDAYGAAEQVHLWPAEQLLDYGNAILSSLRPGMVYVGGTDNGRWIPELLNETSDGERHIIITQNGLADSTYLDFLRLQYEDRFAALSEEDSQRAFQEYVEDAKKRLQHDRQFPDEPKQVRPGEDIQINDGKVQVGGQVAVMGINELLLQTLMQKNPDLRFAIQESFPLRGTYADALPLGPLTELRAASDQNAFTPERAAQSLDYWQSAADSVLADLGTLASESTLKSYSHDVVAAANLLAAHGFTSEAQQAYQLGARLWPGNPESIGGLADLLVSMGRDSEARSALQAFDQKYPDQRESLQRVSAATRFLWTASSPGSH